MRIWFIAAVLSCMVFAEFADAGCFGRRGQRGGFLSRIFHRGAGGCR